MVEKLEAEETQPFNEDLSIKSDGSDGKESACNGGAWV